VARRLGLPTVAVYQTDLPSYARAYRFGQAGEAFAWRWLRGIHDGAVRTLAPSTVTATGLLGQGIENVWLWGRGVDTQRFHPAKRSPQIRAGVEPGGELIAGYVGRLATEKRVDLLAGITALDGVRLVIVGAGPAEAVLRQQLPGAVFLGQRRGEELQPYTPASTCSCTAARTRRSARHCRRRRRAACRWSPRRPEGRST
jgi:phosphatidylinositol alpha 1,6-mannosyltransferase